MLNKLHNGAIVQLRNGKNYIKVDNILVNMSFPGGFMYLTSFDENGTCWDHDFDVMKYNNSYDKDYCNAAHQVFLCDNWTWERENKILTDKEHDYLASVIAPFKNRVVSISKLWAPKSSETEAYIQIIVSTAPLNDEYDYILLPRFKTKEKYVNMNIFQEYKPKELGL